MRRLLAGTVAASVLAATALTAPHAQAAPASPIRLSYVSTSQLANGTTVAGHRVGGLSGLDYEPRTGQFVAISDDKGDHGPARYYRLPASGVLTGHPAPTEAPLLGLAPQTFDLESIRLRPDGNAIVTSEGVTATKAAPFVREYTSFGIPVRDYPIPARYRSAGTSHGFRDNLAFEGSAVHGGTVSLLTESSLAQDPEGTTQTGAPARLLRLSNSGTVRDEYVYRTDPLPTVDGEEGASELLALNGTDYLVIERGYDGTTGRNHVKVFWTTISGAQPITGDSRVPSTVKAMPKTLVFDFASVPRIGNPDNVEGMSFGPRLKDGRRSLVLVSDDNFSSSQKTLFHILAVD
ncbi:esterase-like activity of phytase family protein [Gordonia humi]|uniref:Phytase-like domain-containing protein n=1 Tax=Gordonia humi TaxID=686429 RepID=A0A840F428_9ACTN|nr:esterase-like activity of phytase family protein [Gordonia humi]MBB4137208.1 hypothetical protein [Gordonia humi]